MIDSNRRYIELGKVLIFLSIIIILFDVFAAQLARVLTVSYGVFIVPQIALYFAIGFTLRRRRMGWLDLTIALLITSAVEASAGKEVAEWIGPGRLSPVGATEGVLAFIVVALITTGVGLSGGALTRIYPRR